MDKLNLEQLVGQGLSTRDIGKVSGLSQTSIIHWLKKYDLKTVNPTPSEDYFCSRCEESDKEKFYKTQRWLCKNCFNSYKKKYARDRQKWAIEQLGGKCSNKACNFSQYSCSLDLHHLDPKEKDPNFSTARFWSEERLGQEIKKCIVLCKNCHAAVHDGQLVLPP